MKEVNTVKTSINNNINLFSRLPEENFTKLEKKFIEFTKINENTSRIDSANFIGSTNTSTILSITGFGLTVTPTISGVVCGVAAGTILASNFLKKRKFIWKHIHSN